MRKGNGQPAKLCVGAQALMGNRHGLLVDLAITDATLTEPKAAAPLLDRRHQARQGMSALSADKGYHTKGFVALLRRRKVAPHIARIEGRRTQASMPAPRAMTAALSVSKCADESKKSSAWIKTVGGLKKSRFIGRVKTQLAAYLFGATYNLLRSLDCKPRQHRCVCKMNRTSMKGMNRYQNSGTTLASVPPCTSNREKPRAMRHFSTASKPGGG